MAHTMHERRATKRVVLRRAAWIISSEGRKIPCIVANLSDGGAQVALLGGNPLPERFTLSVEDHKRCARVVWRSAWRLGLAFDYAPVGLVA
jgi:PilZ domain